MALEVLQKFGIGRFDGGELAPSQAGVPADVPICSHSIAPCSPPAIRSCCTGTAAQLIAERDHARRQPCRERTGRADGHDLATGSDGDGDGLHHRSVRARFLVLIVGIGAPRSSTVSTISMEAEFLTFREITNFVPLGLVQDG
jgi:hypothetical protein